METVEKVDVVMRKNVASNKDVRNRSRMLVVVSRQPVIRRLDVDVLGS